tara:strand:+ start:1224 stop:1595 length:372 start_codon:yes stop_codon:yes gene_type:complete
MAVSVTNQSNPLGTQLVQDTIAGSTAVDNTTGTSGTLYAVEVDNSANASAVYFKLADSTDATAGTTAADLVIMVPASSRASTVYPTGIVFSNGFSHWCVTGAGEANVVAPALAVIARYVTTPP